MEEKLMRKFNVTGTVTITVEKEVYAISEEAAIDIASDELQYLTSYVGNGGYNKLIGVDGEGESVDPDGEIQWESAELIEDDGCFECPDCDCECEKKIDEDGDVYWRCPDCNYCWDDEGNRLGYEDDEDEDNED
jgi:hypothetical protein